MRNIAAHKCVRLEIHVPVEQAGEVMGAFGWPTMVDPVPVALARLDLSAAKPQEAGPDTRGIMNVALEHIEHEEAKKPKRKFNDLGLPQQAALLGQREAFWTFLVDQEHAAQCSDAIQAAAFIRGHCGVASRSELAENSTEADKFLSLKAKFEDWLAGPL